MMIDVIMMIKLVILIIKIGRRCDLNTNDDDNVSGDEDDGNSGHDAWWSFLSIRIKELIKIVTMTRMPRA